MTDSDSIAFGHWFAGFVDGEGSFGIGRPRNSYICLFSLAIRRDDRPIMEECLAFLGVGYLRDRDCSNGNPQTVLEVGGKAQCARIVEVFDRFPLRAKKASDFAVWREAVAEWNRIGLGKGQAVCDWTRMAAFKLALETGRQYRPSDAPAPHVEIPPPLPLEDWRNPKPIGYGRSRYIGVRYADSGRFYAYGRRNGRQAFLGAFDTEFEAAQAAAYARHIWRSAALPTS